MFDGHFKAASLYGGPIEQPGQALNVGTEVTSSCSAQVKPCRGSSEGGWDVSEVCKDWLTNVTSEECNA